jgi:hypothetical protein
MPINTQFATEPYLRNRQRSSIGDVVGAVRGIQGIVGTARQSNLFEKKVKDEEYLNELYARNFDGWDGKDVADFQKRNSAVIADVAKTRPDMYSQAFGMSTQLEKAMRESEAYKIDMQNKMFEQRKKDFDMRSDVIDYLTKQQDYVGEQFAQVANENQTYDEAIAKIRRRPGMDKINLPSKEQFESNPRQFYDGLIANSQKAEAMKQQLENEALKLGIDIKKKDLSWKDQLNESLIKQRNRSGTGGTNSGFQLPEGMTAQEYVNATALANKIGGGSRGGKRLLPAVIKAFQEGSTFDEISDSMRYSQQSEKFTGPAREGMQMIFSSSGISGKKKQEAFDAFDDVLDTGNSQVIGEYLKRASREASGAPRSKEINGIERTLEFITEIENDLTEYEKKGGNTNIFTGTYENVNKAIGRVSDPELRKIAEKIQVATMRYRNDISGKAFSIPETKEYKAFMPSISRTSALNSAQIKAIQQTFTGDLRRFYINSMGENAYNAFVSGGGDAGDFEILQVR